MHNEYFGVSLLRGSLLSISLNTKKCKVSFFSLITSFHRA